MSSSSKFTKYQSSWEKDRPWLCSVKDDVYKSFCIACRTSFSTKNNGTDKLKQHVMTEKHEKSAKQMPSQTAIVSVNGNLQLKKTPLQEIATLESQVTQAEVLQALHVVAANQSFASTDGDSSRFSRMFPNSKIAQRYSQHADKTRYVIVYGVAPYVKDMLIADLKDTFFCYKFDETTTSQVKKQYDGYVTYFSEESQQIVTSYCGSLFVGHCNSQSLVDYFYEFLNSMKLSTAWLINIGMDGISVNQSFLRQLASDLSKKGRQFIDIGSCPLHIANNAFKKALVGLKVVDDVDQIATDLHFFFKLSAARREDYKLMEEITEVTAFYIKKHVESRWLSIDRSLVRILEQLPNLRHTSLRNYQRIKVSTTRMDLQITPDT